MEEEQELDNRIKAGGKRKSLRCISFFRDNAEYFFLLVLCGIEKVISTATRQKCS